MDLMVVMNFCITYSIISSHSSESWTSSYKKREKKRLKIDQLSKMLLLIMAIRVVEFSNFVPPFEISTTRIAIISKYCAYGPKMKVAIFSGNNWKYKHIYFFIPGCFPQLDIESYRMVPTCASTKRANET